ncbi:MAG: N-acetyl-alpha-D-glucosaminyl L-malate synthase BshA [Myxococcota bacterium]
MSDRPLNIGITCYPSFGGSGIMATEIGHAMARRGHQVHFISQGVPRRFDRWVDNVFFHNVEARSYPLLEHTPYTVALASKLVEVSRWESLDLLHVHYAVPHASSAFLARATLGEAAPRIVTTLHGTDTTIVGPDSSYRPVTRFCIEQSDGITVPSEFLRREARERLGIDGCCEIRVLPNFVDTEVFSPPQGPRAECVGHLFGGRLTDEDLLLTHVSNFRPVKRPQDVVEVFAAVAGEIPARLVMIGDGPERSRAEADLRARGLGSRVRFLGMQEHFEDILDCSDVFLLPSESESFGLAALEAQSSGVPVVGSDAGGLPEVVADGETGLLAPVGDVEAMVGHVLRLAREPALRRSMARSARERAVRLFRREPVVDRYEAFYRDVMARSRA